MLLIGLSGKMKSGKDSFYEALPGAKRLAFADALKDEVYELVLKPHGIDKKALYDDRKKAFRLILQGWGTDFKRDLISKTYWLDKLREQIEELKDFDGIVCITDVRFKEEADFVLSLGGQMIRVERPGIPTSDHSSECDLDDYKFPITIQNKGTLEEFQETARKIAEVIVSLK